MLIYAIMTILVTVKVSKYKNYHRGDTTEESLNRNINDVNEWIIQTKKIQQSHIILYSYRIIYQ